MPDDTSDVLKIQFRALFAFTAALLGGLEQKGVLRTVEIDDLVDAAKEFLPDEDLGEGEETIDALRRVSRHVSGEPDGSAPR